MARTPAPRRRCSSSSIRSLPRRSEPPFASTEPDLALVGMVEQHLSPAVFGALRGTATLLADWRLQAHLPDSLEAPAGREALSRPGRSGVLERRLRRPGALAPRPAQIPAPGRRTGRHVDRVLACSTWLARALAEAGIDAEALPLPTPPPSPAFVRTPADHPLFVFVGRLSREKGVASLLRAFARLRDAAPTSELRLVGDGDERASLEELARSLRLGDSARLPRLARPVGDRARACGRLGIRRPVPLGGAARARRGGGGECGASPSWRARREGSRRS